MGHGSSRHSSSSMSELSSDERLVVENICKSISRGNAGCSIKREDISRLWTTYLDDTVLRYATRFLCQDPTTRKISPVISAENLGRLYVLATRGRPEERAGLIFDGHEEGKKERVTEIPTSVFLEYVRATISSYLRLLKTSENTRYRSWSTVCGNTAKRVEAHSRKLCEDLIEHGDVVTIDRAENWLATATAFNNIQSHLFRCLFLLTRKRIGEKSPTSMNEPNLLPECKSPCSAPLDPSVLDLVDVLFLNQYLPHELRNEWRFLFSNVTHSESFSVLLSKCLGEGASIVVVQDTDGHVFGGFAPVSWKLGPNFVGDQSSFLFKLEPDIMMFPATGYNDHYQYVNTNQKTMPNGLLMGGQLNYPALWLDAEYGCGKSSSSCTTYQNYVRLSGKEDFLIKHCEIWGVGPVPKNEEEVEESEVTKVKLMTGKLMLKMMTDPSGREKFNDIRE